MARIWLYVGLILALSSCVTNKKYVYLQKDDVNKTRLPKDTVVREHLLAEFDYKIQPNDLISVQFESLTPDEYNFFTGAATRRQGSFNINQGGALLIGELVDENGEITYPVIGKVKVAGKTVFEAQEMLQQLADQYLEAPIVKVRLLNFRITILGEVTQEGTITLTNNRVNIMEAIGQAGGLTDLADKSNVKLIRQKGDRTEIVYINLLEEDFLSSPYYFVNQNDILIVPALRQRPYRRYFGQNLSLIISSLSLLLLVINLSRNN
jgi:polysaccharide export outer membrane protein